MSLFVINRNAKQLDIFLFEFVVRITERTCFLRSARCVVFRIEEKNDTLTFEIGKLDLLACVVQNGKVRRLLPDFEFTFSWL